MNHSERELQQLQKVILLTKAVYIALLSLRFEKHVVPCAQFYVAIFVIGVSVYFLVGSFEHLWGEFMFSFFRGTGIFVIPSIPLLHKENLPQIGKNVTTEKRNLYDSISVSLNIRCAGKSCEKTDRFLQFNVLHSVMINISWFLT